MASLGAREAKQRDPSDSPLGTMFGSASRKRKLPGGESGSQQETKRRASGSSLEQATASEEQASAGRMSDRAGSVPARRAAAPVELGAAIDLELVAASAALPHLPLGNQWPGAALRHVTIDLDLDAATAGATCPRERVTIDLDDGSSSTRAVGTTLPNPDKTPAISPAPVAAVTASSRLRLLLERRGLSAAVISAVSQRLERIPVADSRRLLAGLARRPTLVAALNSGQMTPKAFMKLDDDALSSPALAEARRSAAAARSTPQADDGYFLRLTCPECGSTQAHGSLFNSCAGAKPMLGRSQIVTRGQCGDCGNVWIKDER